MKLSTLMIHCNVEIMLATFIDKHQLPKEFSATAEQYYLPIAKNILKNFEQHKAPYFVGINGCQGSGKSTFTEFVGEYLRTQHNLNVSILSLDDFYLTSKERKELANNIHPLLATRGVPGTHNVTLLKNTLKNLHQQKQDYITPIFDKSIDEPYPKEEWTKVNAPIDIILFEGWCWGVPPQTEEALNTPINTLESQHDPDKEWRTYVNEQITKHYQPLYNMMNYWIVLQAPSFDCVHQWRFEQEQKLAKKTRAGSKNAVMNSDEILTFIQYFQRLTVQALKTLPESADVTLFLNDSRIITHISKAL